jgi:hypothetical protein
MEQIARPSADITLRVARLTALFCSLMAAAYAALQVQPSAAMGLLLTSAPAIVVILWLAAGLFGLILASEVTWFVVAYGLWFLRYRY